MPNIKRIINAHNNKTLNPINPNTTGKTCNCAKKEQCPMNGNCLASSLVYEATISTDNVNYQPKIYIGLCEPTFKKRYYGHKSSFTHEKNRTSSTLSQEVWRVRDNNETPSLSWRIIKTCTCIQTRNRKMPTMPMGEI